VPPSLELPAVLQHALKSFQEKKAAEALSGDLLKERMGKGLGEFLVTSLAFVSQKEARIKEELTRQAQTIANCETALT